MNRDTFATAMAAAQQFIDRGNRLALSITDNTGDWDWPIAGTKETSAVRLASMDLSRALSALRRFS